MLRTTAPLMIGKLTACLLVAIGALALTAGASAKTYRPTRTDDPKPNGCKPNNCSLREALLADQANPPRSCRFRFPSDRGCTTILLRPGKRYVLTRRVAGKDSLNVGDLDLTGYKPGRGGVTYIAVKTAGHGQPATIDANGVDRVFDVGGIAGLSLDRVVLRGGHARARSGDEGSGGAVQLGGNLVMRDSRLIKNIANGSGGAIYNRGNGLRIVRGRLKGNRARGDGGAIAMDGQADRILAQVIRTRATHNRADGAGGMAAFTNEAGISLSRSYVADNRAGGPGGGIESVRGNSAATDVTVDGSTIASNVSGSAGGGLATPWTVVTNSTISANRAATWGGGVVADFGEPGQPGLQMENSTVANNRAGSGGGGIVAFSGLVAFNGPASARLVATTVARNTAGQGGGLYQGAGDTLTVQNTIVALNSAASGADCFTPTLFPSQGHNLIGDPSGCSGFTAAGDLVGGPLKLGKLSKNGGPTKTVALQAGSRAINAGDPAALPTQVVRVDQRGVKRKGPPDIGAYERHKKQKNKKK